MVEFQDFIATFIASLTAFFIYYNFKKFSFWSSRGIDGPTPWPFVGTSIYYFFRPKVEVDFEWRKKYGRYYGIYTAYKPELRICDNELIKHVFIREHSSFTDRNVGHIHHEVGRNWTFAIKGKHWSNQRAILTPIFAISKMKRIFKTVSKCGHNFLLHTESKLKPSENNNSSQNELEIDKTDVMSMTLDSISQSFFSLNLDIYNNLKSEFAKRAFAISKIEISTFIAWMMTPSFLAKWLKFDITSYPKYECFDKLSINLIQDRSTNLSSKHDDLIQAMIDAKLPDENQEIYTEEDDIDAHFNDQIKHRELGEVLYAQSKNASFRSLSDLEMRGHMTFFMIAGFETSANTITNCLYELAHNEPVQQEVYEELQAISKRYDEISYDDLIALQKLDAFVSEVLRLYSTVVEHNRIVTAKDGAILPTKSPIKLPLGTAIVASAICVHRDPEYWTEPEKFDMSRFYPGNKEKIKSCSYMPFGLGPRNCLGLRLGFMQVKIFLIVVLMNYHVSCTQKSRDYPPKFNNHPFFMQLSHPEFTLKKRS